jgi:DNA-binding MarR family transcriptional regulator
MYTKAQVKILKEVQKLGSSFSSASMLANNLNLKISTVKRHLAKLEEIGAVTSSDCTFHDNVKVYELQRDAEIFIS